MMYSKKTSVFLALCAVLFIPMNSTNGCWQTNKNKNDLRNKKQVNDNDRDDESKKLLKYEKNDDNITEQNPIVSVLSRDGAGPNEGQLYQSASERRTENPLTNPLTNQSNLQYVADVHTQPGCCGIFRSLCGKKQSKRYEEQKESEFIENSEARFIFQRLSDKNSMQFDGDVKGLNSINDNDNKFDFTNTRINRDSRGTQKINRDSSDSEIEYEENDRKVLTQGITPTTQLIVKDQTYNAANDEYFNLLKNNVPSSASTTGYNNVSVKIGGPEQKSPLQALKSDSSDVSFSDLGKKSTESQNSNHNPLVNDQTSLNHRSFAGADTVQYGEDNSVFASLPRQKGCCTLFWEFLCCKKDNNPHRDRGDSSTDLSTGENSNTTNTTSSDGLPEMVSGLKSDDTGPRAWHNNNAKISNENISEINVNSQYRSEKESVQSDINRLVFKN